MGPRLGVSQPRPLPPTTPRTYLLLVELCALGLEGAKWTAVRRWALWGPTPQPWAHESIFGLVVNDSSPLSCPMKTPPLMEGLAFQEASGASR